MLKIWLTWLQPSVGVLGTALVLSNPFCTYAATKPVTVRNNVKAPTPTSQWSTTRANGTTIDRELLSGIATTPDLAVRQLAIDSMGAPGTPFGSPVSKVRPSKRSPLASFTSPSTKAQQLSTRLNSKLAQPQKNSDVAAAIARAINPQASVPVPRVYIGNTKVRTASKFTPTKQPVAQAVEIGAPTPLSAMMASKTAIDPFPVVRPELMQKLERMPVAKNVPAIKTAPYAINPIATIPTTKQSVGSKVIVPQAKATSQAQVTPLHSLDPIANIPSGLQRLLGNNINSGSKIAAASAPKKVASKSNPMLAIQQFISPTVATVPSVNAASLRLATAQAYTSVPPKFSIPGETLLVTKQLKPAIDLVAVKRVRQNLTTAVVSRKTNYVTKLAPETKQPWTIVERRNNLGGLILGSQPVVTVPNVASLLPDDTSAAVGLPVKTLVDFN
jgi:hypothetical protein